MATHLVPVLSALIQVLPLVTQKGEIHRPIPNFREVKRNEDIYINNVHIVLDLPIKVLKADEA